MEVRVQQTPERRKGILHFMEQQNVSSEGHSLEWQAEYEFWTKIISDEVSRSRWNEGFEPLETHLYEIKDSRGRIRKYVGTTRICSRDFQASAYPDHDANGRPTLKLKICVAPRKHT